MDLAQFDTGMLQMLQLELGVVGDDVEAVERRQRLLAGAGDVDDIDPVAAAIELHQPDRRAVRVEHHLSGHLPARVERLRLLRRRLISAAHALPFLRAASLPLAAASEASTPSVAPARAG